MNNQIQQVLSEKLLLSLEEKTKILLQMEKETQGLLIDPAEFWESHMEERQKCISKVDLLDQEIEKLLDRENKENKNLIYSVIKSQHDAADVPQEMKPIFEAGQKIFSVLNRIRSADPQIQENILAEQEELLEKIKKGSQSTEAKVSKYFSSFPQESQNTQDLGKV